MNDRDVGTGVVLRVWAKSGSSHERIGRLADGRVRAHLAPPPEAGRANIRLVTLLAALLAVRRDAIDILAGTSQDRKLVRVAGRTADDVRRRIPPIRLVRRSAAPRRGRRGRGRRPGGAVATPGRGLPPTGDARE